MHIMNTQYGGIISVLSIVGSNVPVNTLWVTSGTILRATWPNQ